ncbi:MAG: sigma-70 family RNA polymerase sigma factor [Myxococcales bacterium]|nr:sigma-70 family RNA polymerase sigma factor [Myxococcales bacterium]
MRAVVEGVELRTRLSSPELRQLVERFVRRRVPDTDSDDVVQTVLCEALATARPFQDEEELRRWLVGVARHKVADFHRRGSREKPSELPELEAAPPPVEEGALARWAAEQVSGPDAERTLGWMAREGEGEKLATIAAEEKLPAAAVRQRVSRLRRLLKERWLAELAAVAIVTAVVLLVWRLLTWQGDDPERVAPSGPDVPTAPVPTVGPAPEPTAPAEGPLERARSLRKAALEACSESRFEVCIGGLDAAKGLDPEGDRAPEVQEARRRANAVLGGGTATAASSGSPGKVPSAAPAVGSGAVTPTTTAPPTSTAPPSSPTAFPPKGGSPGTFPGKPQETPQGKLQDLDQKGGKPGTGISDTGGSK